MRSTKGMERRTSRGARVSSRQLSLSCPSTSANILRQQHRLDAQIRLVERSERPDCKTVDYDKRNQRPVMLCAVRASDLSAAMVRWPRGRVVLVRTETQTGDAGDYAARGR